MDKEYEDYQVCMVENGCNAVLFDEWVKTVSCCHCSKKGHIHPTCPLYLDKVKLGKNIPVWGNARKGHSNVAPGHLLKVVIVPQNQTGLLGRINQRSKLSSQP
jgi:hypothetical protein